MAAYREPKSYYAAGILMTKVRTNAKFFLVGNLKGMPTGDQGRGTLQLTELLTAAVEELVALGVARLVEDDFGPAVLQFTDEYALVSLAENLPDSAYDRAAQFGGTWLADAIEGINATNRSNSESEIESEPTAEPDIFDDRWEPLPIDRLSNGYEEAVAALENAISEIAADNGFAAAYPDERDNLISHATATLNAAKSGKITRKQILENFVAAGRWLSEKFGGSVIGALGTELAKWGLRLLGLIP